MAETSRAHARYRGKEWWHGLSPEELAAQRQLLLNEARAGSREAHQALFTSYLPLMLSLLQSGLPKELARASELEDLLQSAALLAWRAFSRFDGTHLAQYQQWLVTICQHRLASVIRALSPGGPHDLARQEPLDERTADAARHPYGRRQPTPDELFGADCDRAELKAAIAQLPADMRQVVEWRLDKRLTFIEMAWRLSRSRHHVERLFAKAVAVLRLRLNAKR